jgi:plasmid maintenance system antidote protein VapI
MAMMNPPHRGGVVLCECVEPLGISPERSIRLSQVFGGSAQSWITQQAQYELAQIPAGRIQLKRLAVA